jgi:hypothetical protein
MNDKIKLIHYSGLHLDKLEPFTYDQKEKIYHAKPLGVWVSVEGDSSEDNISWKEWCISENFQLEHFKHSYEVILKDDANVLHLKTSDEIFEFTKKYPLPLEKGWYSWRSKDTYQIDWVKVAEKYQGIIIAPYQWDCRLSIDCSWYYGWDCASGCIWDLDCIKEFKEVKE